jgi:hypothetical protein
MSGDVAPRKATTPDTRFWALLHKGINFQSELYQTTRCLSSEYSQLFLVIFAWSPRVAGNKTV